MSQARFILLFLGVLWGVSWVFSACNTPKPKLSFYYWKTVFELTEREHQLLSELQIDRLYIRYFDVVVQNDGLEPVGIIQFKEKPSCEVVPVIYLTNEAMQHLEGMWRPMNLADSIMKLVTNISVAEEIVVNEIQLDCDWTESTEKAYFNLVEELRNKNSNIHFSSTIRLHQIKYKERTGIPHVDSGTLMYYNMGSIGADTLNSIYDRSIALQYLSELYDYELPLNVALPIFSWGVQIRGNEVVDLVNKIDIAAIKKDSLFVQTSAREFVAQSNGVFENKYFAQGDRVKLEYATPQAIREAVADIADHVSSTPKEIILYDLDELNFENQSYEKGFFASLCTAF